LRQYFRTNIFAPIFFLDLTFFIRFRWSIFYLFFWRFWILHYVQIFSVAAILFIHFFREYISNIFDFASLRDFILSFLRFRVFSARFHQSPRFFVLSWVS
jgi:hypothetical protein